MTLDHHYQEVRERLRNGYGSDIHDKPVSLKPEQDSIAVDALRKRLNAIQNQVDDQAVKQRYLEREIGSLVQTIGSLKDLLVDYGDKFEYLLDKETGKAKFHEITINRIIQLVSSTEGVGIVQLRGQQRSKRIVYCRHLISYLASNATPKSLVTIGKSLGNRDHTTIMNGIKRLTKRRATDSMLDAQLKGYEEKIAALTAALPIT